MAIERFKDITINGRDFQVGLVTAHVGNWIVLQLAGGKASDFDTFTKIQNFLMSVCSAYVEKNGERFALKLFSDGKWCVPDIEYDLDTVNALYKEALAFNFDPFFEKLMKEPTATSETQT